MDSVTTESTEFWTLWEKARVGCFERTTSKHVYYLGWNISPAQAGCVRQVLRPGALGRLRGIGWRRRWEGGIGMGNTCKSMADSCQCMTKPLQYCKVISLQIIKINGKKINLEASHSVSADSDSLYLGQDVTICMTSTLRLF